MKAEELKLIKNTLFSSLCLSYALKQLNSDGINMEGRKNERIQMLGIYPVKKKIECNAVNFVFKNK